VWFCSQVLLGSQVRATLGQLQAGAPQITVDSEQAQNAVCTLHQQIICASKSQVAFLRVHVRIVFVAIPCRRDAREQPQIEFSFKKPQL
jgi:hypothetical protein